LQKDKKFPKNETFMQLNNEKKWIRKISTTKKKRCHAIYHSLFQTFCMPIFYLSQWKCEEKLRQHTGRSCPHTGRQPVKSPKHKQNKKKIYFRRVSEKRITKSKKPLSKLSKKNLLSVLGNRQKANNIYSMRQYLQCLYWPEGHVNVKLHKKNYCQKFYSLLIIKHIMRTCEPCHITIRNIKNMLL